jgi:hypothetical protein
MPHSPNRSVRVSPFKIMNIKTAIKELTQAGYTSLPCTVALIDGKKQPRFGMGYGWKDRTDPDHLAGRMQALGNNMNGCIIITGSELFPIDLLVIDLDRKPGRDPDGALRQAGIRLPESGPMVKTPRGQHYYFRFPAGLRSGTSAGLFRPDSGIDTRGNGGFVYAPPTSIKGYGGYQWINGPGNRLVEAPGGLIYALIEHERQVFDVPDRAGCKTIGQLSERQKTILFERYQQAKNEGEKDPGNRDRSNYDYRLVCWAVDIGLAIEAIWQLVENIGKFAERGRAYFESTLQRVLCRKKVYMHP